MDKDVVAKLEEAGIETEVKSLELSVGVDVEEGRIRPAGDELRVLFRETSAQVKLQKISALFSGTKTPPSFREGPSDAYIPLFAMIEGTVIDVCDAMERPEYDAEIERLYTHLRRRPDGSDRNPLFSYMQAAVRLYMSVSVLSQVEFDAVCRRLSQSAGRFGAGPTSMGYYEVVGPGLGR